MDTEMDASLGWVQCAQKRVLRRNLLTVGPFDELLLSIGKSQRLTGEQRKQIEELKAERRELTRQLKSGQAGQPSTGYVSELEEKVKDLEDQQRRWVGDARVVIDSQIAQKALEERVTELQQRVEHYQPFEAKTEALEKEVQYLRGEKEHMQRENERLTDARKELVDENMHLTETAITEKQKGAERMNEMLELEKKHQGLVEDNKRLRQHVSANTPWSGDEHDAGSSVATPGTHGKSHSASVFEARPARIQPPSQLVSTKKKGHAIDAITFSPQGTVYATGGSDKVVKLWDATSGEEKTQLRSAVSAVLRVAFNATGDILVAGTSDGSAVGWNTATCRHLFSLCGHTSKVTGLCYADDKMLLTCSGDRTIRRWDLNRGGACTKTTMCWSTCTDLAGEGSVVASAHYDGGLRFWDSRTVNSVEELKDAHSQAITSVCFANSGNRVMTTSREGVFKIFDVRNYQELVRVELRGYQGMLNTTKACFSPDDAFMAIGISAEDQDVVQVYDTTTARPKVRAMLKGGHSGQVSEVTWAPDGASVVSSALDGSVAMWS